MAFDTNAFRKSFPEFSSSEDYPTAMITLWSGLAESMLDPDVWGTVYTLGVSLYTAHELTLGRQNVKAAEVGGAPGMQGGVPSSKSVGSVSVSYDSANTSFRDASFWNMTSYGKQLYRLIRIFGAQAVQL